MAEVEQVAESEETKENKGKSSIQEKPLNMSPGAVKLRSWLNKSLKIQMSDGRILIGIFLCTDRDANVILGSCSEYLSADEISSKSEPRVLGLVMIPGKHIVSIHLDNLQQSQSYLLEYNNEDVM